MSSLPADENPTCAVLTFDAKAGVARQQAGLEGGGPPPVITSLAPGQPLSVDLGEGVQMEFVWIPVLTMWVGKYEVTNGEYRKFKPDHNSGEWQGHSLNGDRQPVVQVSFWEARQFSWWLTEQVRWSGCLPDGYRFRLPSEQEWLTFAQCGDGREYPWGNEWPPPNEWNYCGQGGIQSPLDKIEGHSDDFPVACPVEKSGRNTWDLYGVGDNVMECCASDNSGASFGAWRGFSWYNPWPQHKHGDFLRCSFRMPINHCPSLYLGFRLVIALPFPVVGPLAVVPGSAAAEKPTCAVLTFDAKAGVAKDEAELLSERFAIEFWKLGHYRLINRSKMRDVLELKKFARADNCSSTECAIEAGKLLGAQFMVYGSLGKTGKTNSVKVALVSGETGKIMSQASLDVRGELLLADMQNMARQLAGLEGGGPPPAAGSAPVAKQPYNVDLGGGVKMEFVWIRTLKMWVGKYEVTNDEYRKFKPDHNSGELSTAPMGKLQAHSLNGDRQPAVSVGFEEAKAFARWLTEQVRRAGSLPEGYRFRLPSEQEWLTFAQCGDGRKYPWGNNWPPPNDWNYQGEECLEYLPNGNFQGGLGLQRNQVIKGHNDGFLFACLVEKSGRNDWGLYGVGGNVGEYCVVDSSGAWHEIHGGSWRGSATTPTGMGCFVPRNSSGVTGKLFGGEGGKKGITADRDRHPRLSHIVADRVDDDLSRPYTQSVDKIGCPVPYPLLPTVGFRLVLASP